MGLSDFFFLFQIILWTIYIFLTLLTKTKEMCSEHDMKYLFFYQVVNLTQLINGPDVLVAGGKEAFKSMKGFVFEPVPPDHPSSMGRFVILIIFSKV